MYLKTLKTHSRIDLKQVSNGYNPSMKKTIQLGQLGNKENKKWNH